MAAILIVGAGAANVLDLFGSVDGTVDVEEAIEAEALHNLDGSDGDFTNALSTTAGTDETVTSIISVDHHASVDTDYQAEVTYGETDEEEELHSHLVKTNLGMTETHADEDDGELSVGFVNAEEGSDEVNFQVTGSVDEHNGGLLTYDYHADDIDGIDTVDYEVTTGDSHNAEEEFDWAIAVIEVEEEVETDGDLTLEADEKYYAADWDGQSGEEDYIFETENLEVSEFNQDGAVVDADERHEFDEETQLEAGDYEVTELRFGSGLFHENTVSVTYETLDIDGDILSEEVHSVYEEDGNSIDETLDIGIMESYNLATVTEVDDHSEDFEVVTELSPSH